MVDAVMQDCRDRELVVLDIATNSVDGFEPVARRVGPHRSHRAVDWTRAEEREPAIPAEPDACASFEALEPVIREMAIEQIRQRARCCIQGNFLQPASNLGQRTPILPGESLVVEPMVESLVTTTTRIATARRRGFIVDQEISGETEEARRGRLA